MKKVKITSICYCSFEAFIPHMPNTSSRLSYSGISITVSLYRTSLLPSMQTLNVYPEGCLQVFCIVKVFCTLLQTAYWCNSYLIVLLITSWLRNSVYIQTDQSTEWAKANCLHFQQISNILKSKLNCNAFCFIHTIV